MRRFLHRLGLLRCEQMPMAAELARREAVYYAMKLGRTVTTSKHWCGWWHIDQRDLPTIVYTEPAS